MREPAETYTRLGRFARLNAIPLDEAQAEAARFAREVGDQGGIFRAIDLATQGFKAPEAVNEPTPAAWTATLTP